MPTAYVRKLSKKHGVSTSTAEKHWSMAKAAAKKEGHGEDYGYVTSIFKNMMHEHAFIPTLKELTNGMTFKYFLVAEAENDAPTTKQRSPTYTHLADRFPQFMELPFKARMEIEKEAKELLDGYESLDQEEKDSVDDYLHDMVIDKMQAVVGRGSMVGDWKGEAEWKQRQQDQSDIESAADKWEQTTGMNAETGEEMPEPVGSNTLSLGKKKRFSAGPRHIAAMRQQHIPTDKAAFAPAGADEIGAPVKSYYKAWKDLNPEQLAKRAALAKKHGTLHRVKNSNWFRGLPEDKQQVIVSALKNGVSVQDARKQAGMGGGVVGEALDLEDMKKNVDPKEMRKRVIKAGGNPFGKSKKKK